MVITSVFCVLDFFSHCEVKLLRRVQMMFRDQLASDQDEQNNCLRFLRRKFTNSHRDMKQDVAESDGKLIFDVINKGVINDGRCTFDVIKYKCWMSSNRGRRMGLYEGVIQNDCLKIQEKIMFCDSFVTIWP